jgi:hypothetical protein
MFLFNLRPAQRLHNTDGKIVITHGNILREIRKECNMHQRIFTGAIFPNVLKLPGRQNSSITEAAVDGNWLVVQVRTCSAKEKKFALLLYNVENNFKLEKNVFTDDFLLDVKDGKYYCFANGDPGRDDDTDQCIINIYSWEKTN